MPEEQDPKENASSTRSDMPQDRDSNDHETNPFVAFRRFADEQVSSVLQSITGLPSAFSQPRSDKWAIFTDDQGYRDTAYRQQGDQSPNQAGERSYTSDSGAGGSSSRNKNSDESDLQSSANRHMEQDDHFRSIPQMTLYYGPSNFFGYDHFFDQFEDHFMPFSPRLIYPHRRFPHTQAERSRLAHSWAMPYVLFSPYSPLHLEHQACNWTHDKQGVFSSLLCSLRHEFDHDPNEPRWREAFEDLLRVERGDPMLDPETLAACRAESGQDWLKGLVDRGSMGSSSMIGFGNEGQWRAGFSPRASGKGNLAVPDKELARLNNDLREAETELDMYDRFLQDIEAKVHEYLGTFAQRSLLHNLLDEHRPNYDARNAIPWDMTRTRDQLASEDSDFQPDSFSSGNQTSVSEFFNDFPPWSNYPPAEGDVHHVVSESQRTEQKRLANGSIQSKTVRVTRFADGREDTQESTEVYPPPSSDEKEGTSDEKSTKNGWFWKD